MPQINQNKIVYPNLSYQICGICFKIHNKLERYLNEKQYIDALEESFKVNKLTFLREKEFKKLFKGELTGRNIPDFIIENKIILEIKAKRIITKEDYFQVKRYLSSSKKQLGIIVNFRQKYLNPKRILNKNYLEHSDKNS